MLQGTLFRWPFYCLLLCSKRGSTREHMTYQMQGSVTLGSGQSANKHVFIQGNVTLTYVQIHTALFTHISGFFFKNCHWTVILHLFQFFTVFDYKEDTFSFWEGLHLKDAVSVHQNSGNLHRPTIFSLSVCLFSIKGIHQQDSLQVDILALI